MGLGIAGGIAGGLLGAHYGKGMALKGAAIGLISGVAADMVLPEMRSDKGPIGNMIAGGLRGAAYGTAASIGVGMSLLRGGPGNRLFHQLNRKWLPALAEGSPGIAKGIGHIGSWFSKIGQPAGPNRVGIDPADIKSPGWLGLINESRGMFSAGDFSTSGMKNLGFYAGFGPSMQSPSWMQSIAGVPNTAKVIGSVQTSTSLRRMGADILPALKRDFIESGKATGLMGIGAGAIASLYYGLNRVPQGGGVYGGGMYDVTGLASNQALNPL